MKIKSLTSFCGKFLLMPFAVCVLFLRVLGALLGLDYKQISVYFNIHLQGTLLCLSGVSPLLAVAYRCAQGLSWCLAVLFLAFAFYAAMYVAAFVWLFRHYKLPCYDAFDRCVADLKHLGAQWRMSYYAVNLLLFVVGWLALVIINMFLVIAIYNCNVPE